MGGKGLLKITHEQREGGFEHRRRCWASNSIQGYRSHWKINGQKGEIKGSSSPYKNSRDLDLQERREN